MRLYLVRHGQTDVNLKNLINSLNDDDLNENGINSACELREFFTNIDYDFIICSPLTRTKHTAELLNVSDKKIIYDDRLLERDAGVFTKVPVLCLDSCDWWNINPKNDYKNAESVIDVLNRGYSFLNEIKDKYSDKNIIIVTHGGIIKIFRCYFEGIPEDGNLEIYNSENCSVFNYEL